MARAGNGKRKRRAPGKRQGAARGGMAPWYVLGLLVVAGMVLYDRGFSLPGPESGAGAIRTASVDRRAVKDAVMPRPKQRPLEEDVALPALPAFSGKWFICTTDYCVLDGNTILHAGRKVRLADIDAPSVADARCDAERLRAGDAKLRLREILSEGEVTLGAASSADGRKGAEPRVVLVKGQSAGGQLVREGLAKPWTGKHRSWCG